MAETILKCDKKSEQIVASRKFAESVDRHDFKRQWAFQNWVWKAENQQFLVHGGREIKAALDAEYPLLEVWVAE